MKKIMNFALMAALTVGLSLAATSCKDDDKSDNNNGENMEQLESTGGDLTMDEVQLSSLISNFSAVQADELLAQSGWQQKTYDVDFGMVLDESRPTVRTVEVGTLEEADEEACALLDQLGIDFQSPAGFTFSNAQVGTVSYQHGGGADANTLAVINLDVRQLPGISQLRLVKQMPANAGDAPRYHLGDIIRKKGDQRLWLCVRQSSDVGGHAYFVSFWTDHPKDNCGWGSENDYVYKASTPMASQLSLGYWLALYVMNDQGYSRLTGKLEKKGVKGRIDDLIPSTQEIRAELIDNLRGGVGYKEYREPLESPEGMERLKWASTTKANGRIVAPRGRLLCDKFRWASGLYHDYWVPNLTWINADSSNAFEEALNSERPQNEGSHFKWKMSPLWNAAAKQLTDDPLLKNYRVVCTAVYWQHKYYNNNQWAMFDFTKDWAEHPTQANAYAGKSKWLTRNITSSELMITDTGEALKGYDEVWVAVNDQELEEKEEDKNDENLIHKDEVKLYSIIGTNGKFYDNVQAAKDAGTTPMAIVTYLGETKRAERGQAWNQWDIIPEKLTATVYGGIYRFFNYGEDYTHTYTSFNGGCSLQAYLGRWTLGAYADNGWNFMEGEHRGHQAPAWYITCNYRMNDAFSISLYAQHPFSQHPLTNKTEVVSRYVRKEISQHCRDYGNMLTLKLSYRLDYGRKYRDIQRSMNHSDKETGILSK